APRGRRDRVYRRGVTPRDWANESWSFSFLGPRQQAPKSPSGKIAVAHGPAAAHGRVSRIEFTGWLMQRGERRAQHRAGLVAAAVLDQHGRGIDAVAQHAVERHGPASRTAIEVADLEQVAHHVVVDDFASTVFTAADRNRHRLGNRT